MLVVSVSTIKGTDISASGHTVCVCGVWSVVWCVEVWCVEVCGGVGCVEVCGGRGECI